MVSEVEVCPVGPLSTTLPRDRRQRRVRISGPDGGDEHGVLDVRGERPVGGDDGPAVVELDGVVGAAGDEHRLDRQHHADGQRWRPCPDGRGWAHRGPRASPARCRARSSRAATRSRRRAPPCRPPRRCRRRGHPAPSRRCPLPATGRPPPAADASRPTPRRWPSRTQRHRASRRRSRRSRSTAGRRRAALAHRGCRGSPRRSPRRR